MARIETTAFDSADYLGSAEAVAAYLDTWLEDGTPDELRRALATVARSHGVSDLARRSGVSWRTLENAFADFRGCTVVAYLRNRRLDKARRALEEDAATVSEIATRFGFRSPTTFALEFRKRFGMPPSRARARKES